MSDKSFVDGLKEMGVDNETLNQFGQVLDIPDSIFEANIEEFRSRTPEFVNEDTIKVLLVDALMKGITKERFMEETKDANQKFINLIQLGAYSDTKKNFFIDLFKLIEQKIEDCLFRQKIPVKFEKITPETILPTYAHPTDACADIYAAESISIKAGEVVLVPTGFKMAIPEGYEVTIRPRSGMSIKTTLIIPNSPGTIDCGYRDEVKVPMRNVGNKTVKIEKGDRIAQMAISISPMIEIEEVESVAAIGGNREGGFGSTGK